MRVKGADGGRDLGPGSIPPPVGSSLDDPVRLPQGIAASGQATRPVYEEDVLEPAVLEPGLPPMPLEHHVVHAPMVAAVRKESSYESIDDLVNINLEAYAPAGEELGYFRRRILPKEDETIEVLPKDVTFVVDASNSISQHKLSVTTKGVKAMVDKLGPEDRFDIVIFLDSP